MAIPYVILGGGVAAGYAAQEFIEQGIEPGELRIISADERLPYDRPPLSKAYMAGKKSRDDILINPEDFYKQNGVDVQLKTRIKAIDLGARRLYDKNGLDTEFDQLLIATGSRVRWMCPEAIWLGCTTCAPTRTRTASWPMLKRENTS